MLGPRSDIVVSWATTAHSTFLMRSVYEVLVPRILGESNAKTASDRRSDAEARFAAVNAGHPLPEDCAPQGRAKVSMSSAGKTQLSFARRVLGRAAKRASSVALRPWLRRHGIESPGTVRGSALAASLRSRLLGGETVLVLGVTTGTHNAGLALVSADEGGLRLIANHEEERFSGVKHDHGFPLRSAVAMQRTLRRLGKSPADIAAFVGSFDYLRFASAWAEYCAHDFPHNLPALRQQAGDGAEQDFMDVGAILSAPQKLAGAFGLEGVTLHGLAHHRNHAWGSYALSPFYGGEAMVLVTDGMGDDSAISSYMARDGEMRRVGPSKSLFDSLGLMYQVLSSTQGGWTPLSSEGRYMGAAAWGDRSRESNPYYARLRALVRLDAGGEVRLDRRFVHWHRDPSRPYTKALVDILGAPIPRAQLWNPDVVLAPARAESQRSAAEARLDQVRLDRAAAVQLVFEDAVVHLVRHLKDVSGLRKLVWTGGSALNCSASAHLLEELDDLELWVPPFPGDAGAAAGAAFHALMECGEARRVHPLRDAFLCGDAPRSREVVATLRRDASLKSRSLGNVCSAEQREDIADLCAFLLSKDAVLALYQGRAETGPRALGHRSILANATNPHTLDVLNARVKRRERVRPLAPMVTRESAAQYFELAEGARAKDFDAYRYMVLTAKARPLTQRKAPAIVHVDGSSRIQIVDAETQPLCHAILRAMGRHVGVEIMVNTSLNVGSPIVQTPDQAAEVLHRARGMHAALWIDDEGEARLISKRGSDEEQDLASWVLAWTNAWTNAGTDA